MTRRWIAVSQALYYLLTGVWPLLDIRSFERATGPKADDWLVKTVGVVVAVIGSVLGVAGFRQTAAPEIPLLAVGSAVGLASIDVVYATRGRISRIYLVDALVQCAFVVAWALGLRAGLRLGIPEHSLLSHKPV